MGPWASAGKSPRNQGGFYWTYGQKDLYDIKIHNFSFHKDSLLEFSLPECLSITRYDSISGEELSPYRRLSAGCIKTYIGGYEPYQVLIHKNIPIRSIGIEIMPAYYEDYLKKQYPEEYRNPVEAFRKIDQTTDFPEMSRLLSEVQNYHGDGIAIKLFYESKVAEALSLVVEYQKNVQRPTSNCLRRIWSASRPWRLSERPLCGDPHGAADADRLHGKPRNSSSFKRFTTAPSQSTSSSAARGSQAEYLLTSTDLSIGQIAQTVGYSTSSRFAGAVPEEYRATAGRVRKVGKPVIGHKKELDTAL